MRHPHNQRLGGGVREAMELAQKTIWAKHGNAVGVFGADNGTRL